MKLACLTLTLVTVVVLVQPVTAGPLDNPVGFLSRLPANQAHELQGLFNKLAPVLAGLPVPAHQCQTVPSVVESSSLVEFCFAIEINTAEIYDFSCQSEIPNGLVAFIECLKSMGGVAVCFAYHVHAEPAVPSVDYGHGRIQGGIVPGKEFAVRVGISPYTWFGGGVGTGYYFIAVGDSSVNC